MNVRIIIHANLYMQHIQLLGMSICAHIYTRRRAVKPYYLFYFIKEFSNRIIKLLSSVLNFINKFGLKESF